MGGWEILGWNDWKKDWRLLRYDKLDTVRERMERLEIMEVKDLETWGGGGIDGDFFQNARNLVNNAKLALSQLFQASVIS